MTAIYDRHGYDDQKRGALTRWDKRIAHILTGERAKVIEMPVNGFMRDDPQVID